MWNGNNYGGYMPYSTPYNGYNNNQGNYTGQVPFAPQNGNYVPPAQSQQQPKPFISNINYFFHIYIISNIRPKVNGLSVTFYIYGRQSEKIACYFFIKKYKKISKNS